MMPPHVTRSGNRNVLASIVVVLVFAAGYIAGNVNSLQSVAYAQSQTRVFELIGAVFVAATANLLSP